MRLLCELFSNSSLREEELRDMGSWGSSFNKREIELDAVKVSTLLDKSSATGVSSNSLFENTIDSSSCICMIASSARAFRRSSAFFGTFSGDEARIAAHIILNSGRSVNL